MTAAGSWLRCQAKVGAAGWAEGSPGTLTSGHCRVGSQDGLGGGGTWGEGVSLSSVILSPAGEEKRIREFYQSRGLDRVTQPSNEGGHAQGPCRGA